MIQGCLFRFMLFYFDIDQLLKNLLPNLWEHDKIIQDFCNLLSYFVFILEYLDYFKKVEYLDWYSGYFLQMDLYSDLLLKKAKD